MKERKWITNSIVIRFSLAAAVAAAAANADSEMRMFKVGNLPKSSGNSEIKLLSGGYSICLAAVEEAARILKSRFFRKSLDLHCFMTR